MRGLKSGLSQVLGGVKGLGPRRTSLSPELDHPSENHDQGGERRLSLGQSTSKKSRSRSPVTKECLFGRPLEQVVLGSATEVPKMVVDTIAWLSSHVQEDGLCRMAGAQDEIAQMQAAWDADCNGSVDYGGHDVHAVACLLKLFFRRLPSPLLPQRFYSTFLKVSRGHDETRRKQNMLLLVQGLPATTRPTLLTLLRFLKAVSEHAEVNRMTEKNLAIVWAPNLLWDEEESIDSVALNSSVCVDVVSTLIADAAFFSTEKRRNLASASLSEMPELPELPIFTPAASASAPELPKPAAISPAAMKHNFVPLSAAKRRSTMSLLEYFLPRRPTMADMSERQIIRS